MAPKRSRVAAHDDAAFEAKRCRRLGQLVAEYGADENLIEPVEVVVDGVVHRMSAVLLAQSDVFRGMLTGGLREATQRRIELRDMSAACWAALRAYLQSGEVRVEESATAVEVLQAAHMYELPPLADAVEQRVADVCDEGECDEDALIDLLDLAESLEMAKLTASVARALIAVDPESERAAKALQTVPKASEILFADWQATEKVLASVAVGPLPGRYAVGEKVYYTAGTLTIQEGYKITHGQAGEVKGPKPDNPDRVYVMFPGNKGIIGCRLTELSRAPPPPLPGGYAVGEKVYFTGDSQTFGDGYKVKRGQRGEVMGHPDSDSDSYGKGVTVMFPRNKGSINCYLTQLSRSKP